MFLKKHKKGLIITGTITGVVLIALIIVYNRAGEIARQYIEKHSVELIGRKVSIKNIDLSLLRGEASIDSLCLKEQDGQRDFVTWDTLYVNLKLTALLHHKIILEHIHLTGLDANVEQKGDRFNFTDIIEKFSTPDTAPKDTTPSKWAIGLNDIRLRNCNVHYKDLLLGSQFNTHDVNLDIPGLYFSNQQTDVGLHLAFEEGGQLQAQMKYAMESSKYTLSAQLNHFAIDGIQPYMHQGVKVGKVDGFLNVKMEMTGDFDHMMNFTLKGTSSIDNLNITDDQGRLVMQTAHTQADLVRLNLTDNEVHLGKVIATGSRTQFLIGKNGKDNISYFISENDERIAREKKKKQVLKDSLQKAGDKAALQRMAEQEKADTQSDAQQAPLKFKIDQLRVEGLNVHMEDRQNVLPFTYDIKNINVSADNFTLDKKNNVKFKADMGKTGKVFGDWKGSTSDMNNQNLTLNLSNIALSELTPYFDPIFGYRITDGNLSLISQNKIVRGNLNGINNLSIYNITVAKDKNMAKPEYKIPLKAALYIAKDKDNKIDIDLPLSGNLNSPEFNVKKIVVKTLVNFLVKIAEAPFKSLGKLLGLTHEHPDQIEYDPTRYELSAEEYGKLNNIKTMMSSKPKLPLVIEQQINYSDAIEQMAVNEMKNQYYLSRHAGKSEASLEVLERDSIRSIKDNDAGLTAFAARKVDDATAKSLTDKALYLYKNKATTQLEMLAQRRNSTLKNYLTQQLGLTANKVTVTAPAYNANKKYKGNSILQLKIGGDE